MSNSARPLHPSLLRRPARTSGQAERVEVFSDVEIGWPMRRFIRVRTRAGHPPVLEVGKTRDGVEAGGFHIHQRCAAPLVEAIRLASDPMLGDGRRECGEIVMKSTAKIAFAVLRHPNRPVAISFTLVRANGQPLGRPYYFRGAELDALRSALAALMAGAP